MSRTALLGDLFYAGPDREVLLKPRLGPRQESSRPGVHLVGEISGTPLMKNSLNAGATTVRELAVELLAGELPTGVRHLVIVGAGAAGLAAAMEAQALGLSYVVLEQGRIAETIQRFHTHKKIFAEPSAVENESRLWFAETNKEELLEKWQAQLDDEEIEIRSPVSLRDVRDEGPLKVVITDEDDYRCLRVILAIGRSGNPHRLRVPGENLPKVHSSLDDPETYQGKRIAVVGAGDTAAEIALALMESNNVTLLVRGDHLDRPRKRYQDRLGEAQTRGVLDIRYRTRVKEIAADRLMLDEHGERRHLENEEVFLALGNELPVGLLRTLGIRMENEWTWKRWLKLAVFGGFVSLLYLWKAEFFSGRLGAGWISREALRDGWLGTSYRWLSTLSDLGAWIPATPSMVFGMLYSVIIVFFGLKALRKYRNDPFQRKKYKLLMFAQVVCFWLIPEFLFQGILTLGEGAVAQELRVNGWRAYGLFIPAPLYVWNFWSAENANSFWLIWTLGLSFVGVPLIAKFTGKKFCSWFCPCGGLAETFGDRWRHLAPRGRKWRAWENLGQISVTALVACLVGYGVFNASSGSWTVQYVAIDIVCAGIVGVGLYPFLGNRIWCRFLCPLSRVLHVVSGNVSKVELSAGSHCIECGLCSNQCQMGIPVMEFAKNGESIDNRNSGCIQCGVCVSVCPVRNLQNGPWKEETWRKTVQLGAMTEVD